MSLITSPNLDAPDDFYEALLQAHSGLPVPDSHAFNARLILLLANHIGRLDVLKAALAAAKAPAPADAPSAAPPAASSAAPPAASTPAGRSAGGAAL